MQDPQVNDHETLDIPVDVEDEQIVSDAGEPTPDTKRSAKPWDAKMDAIKIAAKNKARAEATQSGPTELEKAVHLYLLAFNRHERRAWLAKQRRAAGVIRGKSLTAKKSEA